MLCVLCGVLGRLGVPASTSCCSSIVWGGRYILVENSELFLLSPSLSLAWASGTLEC